MPDSGKYPEFSILRKKEIRKNRLKELLISLYAVVKEMKLIKSGPLGLKVEEFV